ncbi:MAG: electron transfer flavoprotein subunit beta/FixA family protein [Thermaerobacter sp.]|nr:electron transfer flavoprotein subunit beta/FixA family protein [Bacillota bacterium]
MHIVVCIKQILDPEIPPARFQVDPSARQAVRGSAGLVISPFDENALELGLQLKEKHPGTRLTAVTMGDEEAVEALRKALALGADQVVLAADPAFNGLDSYGTARVLARCIEKLGGADLVLFGRQAGDWDHGLVGSLAAEELAIPCVTLVREIQMDGDGVRLVREGEGGVDVIAGRLPLAATVTNADSNQIRFPKVRDMMLARGKPITRWSAQDLGLDPADLEPTARAAEIDELFVPDRTSSCQFIDGEDGAEKARKLVQKLRELKLL